MSTAFAVSEESSAAARAATVAALRRQVAAVPARPERALSVVPEAPEPVSEPRPARRTRSGAGRGEEARRAVAGAVAEAGVVPGDGLTGRAVGHTPVAGRAADSVAAVPLPEHLRGVVAGGALTPGQTVACSGGHGMLASLLAAATGAGRRCAIIGYPELALAAIAAEGGDLSQLALVPAPGADPGAVASVLLDGMDLVLLDPACGRIAPSRARVLAGRARTGRAVLLVGAYDWPAADLRLDSGAARATGLDHGYGRITVLTLPVRVRGKGFASDSAPVVELRQLGWRSRSVADLEPVARRMSASSVVVRPDRAREAS